MAWLAVNYYGQREFIFEYRPNSVYYTENGNKVRDWDYEDEDNVVIELPKGTIKKIIGRGLSWEDEPVEI